MFTSLQLIARFVPVQRMQE